jgi:trimeric autotransporter adhesin
VAKTAFPIETRPAPKASNPNSVPGDDQLIQISTKPNYKWRNRMSRTALICITGAASILIPTLGQAQTPPTYGISNFAGNYTSGFSGDAAAAISAQLAGPSAVTVDKAGNVYVADQSNNRIRKIDTSGNITTVAGNGTAGYTGDGSAATGAELYNPGGLLADGAGNLYISDTANNVIRKVTTGGTISTIGGNNSLGAGYAGDGGPATSAQIYRPSGLAIDSTGTIYFADSGNNAIRVILPNGNMATVAGLSTPGFSGDGGLATSAKLNNPIGLAVDRNNNLYIADGGNNRIRIVSGNIINTFAGVTTSGFSGDGGPATKAKFTTPKGVAVDSAGNVFIVDTFNGRIRVVTPDGNINTVAGSGAAGSGGDGGDASVASLFFPTGIALDPNGKVYIADTQNNVVRLLTPRANLAPSITVVQSAGAYGGFSTIAPGSWVEIFGSNFSTTARSWTTTDFNGNTAPTSLDGVSVSIGGQAAFVNYISATQINVQVPSNVAVGSQPLTVTSPAGTSAAKTMTVAATQPGILAPSSFLLAARQYAAALFPDFATYVLPVGVITGLSSRPAKPGDTIILYGVGFGTVNPSVNAGQITQQSNKLTSNLLVTIGGVAATVTYAGLTPGVVGLYQFNVVVPNVGSSDLVPLSFSLGGVNSTQTLYIAVQN